MSFHETAALGLRAKNKLLTGVPLAPGLAMGRAYIYHEILDRPMPRRDVNGAQLKQEYERIEKAFNMVQRDLQKAARQVKQEIGKPAAAIFMAQEMMLLDATLMAELRQELKITRVNAEQVVKNVFDRWEKRFSQMSDPIMRERTGDILDLCRRVLRALSGIQLNILERMPRGSVLVAKHLLPSEVVLLKRLTTAAVVVEFAGTTSHAALLIRQMGIPAVTQMADVLGLIKHNDPVVVDGSAGTVLVAPDAKALALFQKQSQIYSRQELKFQQASLGTAKTPDGVVVKVMANVASGETVQRACDLGADGIGLYRVENYFLSQKYLPTEQELLGHLAATLEPVQDKPVTLRLLDLGGDKEIPYLNLTQAAVSELGRRGVRVYFEFPDLLRVQLRALLRLSGTRNLQILVPMVTLTDDMVYVRDMLRSEADQMQIKILPPLGAMVETPAAALNIKGLLASADFFSIGTNDLTQYTMAASRENEWVQRYFDDRHPAVYKLLRIILQDAQDKPVSLCGELAGRKDALPDLLDMGFRRLSVAPSFVPAIKDAVRHHRIRRP